jgi:RimJ/RimL family protein N-acetyltransferase
MSEHTSIQYEISKLGLPKGRWQEQLLDFVGEKVDIGRVDCYYPTNNNREVTIAAWTSGLEGAQRLIAQFSLSFMPGCKGILISHATAVSPEFQGRGVGRAMSLLKSYIAWELRCSKMIATVLVDNTTENHLLESSNWKRVGEPFVNTRTGHNVQMWERRVYDEL